MRRILIPVLLAPLILAGCASADPTVTPLPTNTPEPTRSPAVPARPTATPAPDDLSALVFELSGRGPVKSYPAALAPDAPQLPPEQVVQLWEEFLLGTRMETSNENADAGFDLNFDFEFCDDYTGRIQVEIAGETVRDMSVKWRAKPDSSVWNSVVAQYYYITDSRIGDGQVGPNDSESLFFIDEEGIHYVSTENVATFTELRECTA